jgi:membrane dipeptidase (peptidase family M19)
MADGNFLPRVDLPRVDLPRVDLPRVDLHSHAGRCFLAGLPAGHPVAAALGAASVADALRAARAAGMTALCLSAVADFAVLRPDPATGSSDTGHPRLMTAPHAAAIAEAGGLVGAWPCGITSRSLADFGTEIIRLTEAAGPDHVALGTDLDGNYRPVLTSYDQLDDLASLLQARDLPATHVNQILGGNALTLLHGTLPSHAP